MYIYKITNKKTNKSYIGMTKRTPEKRFKSHLYEAKVQKYNMYLHNSIRKYGSEYFILEVIEECNKDDAPKREIHWIKTLNTLQPNGYNEHLGGKGGCLNASPELRKKLSIAKKGKFIPWNKGLTKETDPRVKNNAIQLSNSKKGIKFTEIHKLHLSQAQKKRRLLRNQGQSTNLGMT